MVFAGQTTTYTYGPDGGRQTKTVGGSETFYAGGASAAASYLHRDHLASVRLITDASGNVEQSTSFTPFGDPDTTTLQPSATPEERSFIGERYDASTGLLYLNARYMDPALGRFIQPDWWEVRRPGVGTNRYSYSFNDPVNNKDASGNACTVINRGSPYCRRMNLYNAMNDAIAPRYNTNYFAGLALTVEFYGSTDLPLATLFDGMSSEVSDAMRSISDSILEHNMDIFVSLTSGGIDASGSVLEQDLLLQEQSILQGNLDSIKSDNPDLYGSIISQMNENLNNPSRVAKIFPSDRQFMGVIEQIRAELGRDVDFSDINDRLRIGQALVEFIDQQNE